MARTRSPTSVGYRVFLIPGLVLTAVVVGVPLIGTIAASFTRWQGVGAPVWTGVHLQETSQPLWKRIGRVLCAIDLRTPEPALTWARDFAAEFEAELIVVHAVQRMDSQTPLGTSAAQADEHIRCLLRKLAAAGEVEIEEGDPAQVVRAAATRRNADVVVIGRSPREGALGRLRTNAYSIVRDAPCPVVSV